MLTLLMIKAVWMNICQIRRFRWTFEYL